MQVTQASSVIDDARNVRNYIFTKAILLAKFVKISSLKNYRLYGIRSVVSGLVTNNDYN